ncbi:MAG: filament integrity protein FraC [Pseudomonadota bacterium]
MDTLYVLPLKVITTQALFLVVAIAIESYMIQRLMQYPPRKCIEYAASINLLSTVIGWLVFFSSPFFLPSILKLQIINYVVFGSWNATLLTWLIPLGFLTFFGTIGVEYLGFILLERFLSEKPFFDEAATLSGRRNFFQAVAVRPKQTKAGVTQPDILQAVISGNSFSYGIIFIVLVALQVTRVIGPISSIS